MKLTPIYATFYVIPNVSGNNRFPFRQKKDRYGVSNAVPTSRKQAEADILKLQKEGYPAFAYHYGWKEKGLKPDLSDKIDDKITNPLYEELQGTGNFH